MTRSPLALTLLAALWLAGPAWGQDAPELPWAEDLQQARARAAEEGRPLLVVFR